MHHKMNQTKGARHRDRCKKEVGFMRKSHAEYELTSHFSDAYSWNEVVMGMLMEEPLFEPKQQTVRTEKAKTMKEREETP